MNIKTINKVLSVVLVCQVIFLFVCLHCLPFFMVEETDAQRETILSYIEQDKFTGMSVNECKEVLGEPFLENESELYFYGGSDYKAVILTRSYDEYELRVFLDEDGNVYNVWYYSTLSLMY